jgi:hypothetical protein
MFKIKMLEKFDSASDFAEHVKVDETLISKIIWARRDPNPEQVKHWAVVLACDPKFITHKRKGDPKK